MAINKKLIHFQRLSTFKELLAANNILDTSIVFIKDAQQIWTHGQYYAIPEVNIGDTEPEDGDVWIDTSVETEDIILGIYIGTTEPTDGLKIWINPDTDEIKYNKDGVWAIAGVEEAPKDGKYYARKDGEWSVASSTITLIAETNTGDNTDVANVIFTVTIDGVALLVNNGDSINVEAGKTVKVECPSVENYFTPASVEFTTELFLSYTKTFIYTYNSLGVFIQDKNGKLWTTDNWDASNNANANAIAVLTSNVKVLVALTDSGVTKQIHSSHSGALENYMTAISDTSAAKADYKGKENTTNIMKLQSSTSYAAGWANAFTFPDGTKGHLPSLGEFWEVYQNKSAVDAALAKCGGSAMYTGYHWCSTFWGVGSVGGYPHCWILAWSNGGTDNDLLNYNYYVRAFAVYNP